MAQNFALELGETYTHEEYGEVVLDEVYTKSVRGNVSVTLSNNGVRGVSYDQATEYVYVIDNGIGKEIELKDFVNGLEDKTT